MTYQNDPMEDGTYEICYVCGHKKWVSGGDLATSIMNFNRYDRACMECVEAGAPGKQPDRWSRADTDRVLAARKRVIAPKARTRSTPGSTTLAMHLIR